MLRRLALTAVVSLAALTAAAPAATAVGPLPCRCRRCCTGLAARPQRSGPSDSDGLGVGESGGRRNVRAGVRSGGWHPPEAQRACDRLTEAVAAGEDPFAPTAREAMCTQQAGGPAAARIQGTWQGQQLDARFSRANGCEISRWNSLVPLLPPPGRHRGHP
ncbi:SSI family serine proteinase inhibitor [Streptomyces sp. M10(2022)]